MTKITREKQIVSGGCNPLMYPCVRPRTGPPVRIVIAHSEELMRESLAAVLSSREGLVVSGQAATGREALELVKSLEADVLLASERLLGINSMTLVSQVTRLDNACAVLLLVSYVSEALIQKARDAGVIKLISADTDTATLTEAIERAGVVGQDDWPNPFSRAAISVAPCPATSGMRSLTDRERLVLQLVSEGYFSKEIAAMIDIVPKTVDTHRRHTMQKLGVNSVAELTRFAVREGLVDLGVFPQSPALSPFKRFTRGRIGKLPTRTQKMTY
jgi:two-component system, LuxR family, secretion system response regulator SsrB